MTQTINPTETVSINGDWTMQQETAHFVEQAHAVASLLSQIARYTPDDMPLPALVASAADAITTLLGCSMMTINADAAVLAAWDAQPVEAR
jgi:hypothetical protein